jgi:ABC-2 type transport system ATP-binding protein
MSAGKASGTGAGAGAVLFCEGLERSYGKTRALQGLSFAVTAGELYGLVGPDGAGKTTAMRIFAGLMKPDAGMARVLGVDPIAEGGRVRDQVGYMPQQYSLYGDLTVGENLHFFARLFGISRAEERERTTRLLNITRLEPFVTRRAEALSGGMYKKLALSCALLHRPRLLLLDEPTNGVDPVSRRELWALLYEFVGEGMAVVVSTPYMDEAERCRRVGLIDAGRLTAEGPPAALVAAFDEEAYEVVGGERTSVLAALDRTPGLLARSPAGARLHVVVGRGRGDEVRSALRETGAELVPARPSFEDVFIVKARRS